MNKHRFDWSDCTEEQKRDIIKSHSAQLSSEDKASRSVAVSCIAYIAMGNYGSIESTEAHVHRIKENTLFLWENGIIPPLYLFVQKLIDRKVPENLFDFSNSFSDSADFNTQRTLDQELMNALTIFYFIIEANRHNSEFAKYLDTLNPSILEYLMKAIGRLRWGINGNLPLRNLFQLYWKLVLTLFGGSDKRKKTQSYMLKKYNLPTDTNPDEVTASPLDYHAFRQDIISRYPSYIPPSSTLPTNFENIHSVSHYIEIPRPAHAQTSNKSLPAPTVHIATPAPSPSSSPAITAGQKVKKSVFMTNQSFPFIHPTDDTVPQSIIEASELFSERVRTTPAMFQLWDERDRFMKQERGWDRETEDKSSDLDSNCPESVILKRVEKLYVCVDFFTV